MKPEKWEIGIDLGASSFKCGLISPEFRIVARNEAPTLALHGPDQAADRIAKNVQELLALLPHGNPVERIGICSPGPINHETGYLIEPPNLTGWKNVPFAEMLSSRLRMPVTLEHDAKASALGEYHYGAGRGARSMALVIVGTGVSTGMIVDGKLYRGDNDSAGEIGHMTVELGGPICRCGANGCVEVYASGPAIVNAYNYATRKNVESGEEIVRAAQEGDDIARRVYARAGRALGAAVATVAQVMDISTFVFFGSGTKAGDLLLVPAREAVKDYSYSSVSARVRMVLGELGNDAGILGAAYAARHSSEEK